MLGSCDEKTPDTFEMQDAWRKYANAAETMAGMRKEFSAAIQQTLGHKSETSKVAEDIKSHLYKVSFLMDINAYS